MSSNEDEEEDKQPAGSVRQDWSVSRVLLVTTLIVIIYHQRPYRLRSSSLPSALFQLYTQPAL